MTDVSIEGIRDATGGVAPLAEQLRSLAADLEAAVSGHVGFGAGDRALYATDASNYRQPPIGVVVPRTIDDIVAAVAVCRDHDAAVLARGGGTSLAGQCCNTAVVIDTARHLRGINWIDPDRRLASVQPGCVLDDLRDAATEHGLTLGPDPSTHNRCTVGGMVGNNACGIHAQMAGRMADNVEELEVLTYGGERFRVGPTSEDEWDAIIDAGGERGRIYAELRDLRDRYAEDIRQGFPDLPRRVSGYCLEKLLPEHGGNVAAALVGTEGTCVLVLEVVVKLVPARPERTLVVLGYPDVTHAADHLQEVLEHEPIALEGFDEMLIDNSMATQLVPSDTPVLPEGRGWLMVQFGADTRGEADDQARAMLEALSAADDPPTAKLFDDPDEEAKLWDIREAGLGATAWVPGQPDRWPGWEDSAVPPERLGDYLRDLESLFFEYGYSASLYGHFGQGCVHCRIDFGWRTAEGIEHAKAFLRDAADLVVRYGGSLSGEHGDGQARGWLLERMYGPELMEAFRRFRAIWDPRGRLNPGKVVDADPVDAHLRLGTDYAPPELETHFAYPRDQGSFARAALRCVGVGACRRESGGTMCPSYQVTYEEQHSTRGRARLLWEMLNGELADEGWRSEDVRDALDLCLSCKGCKTDCPVGVDMATYKAEFLSHHYAGRLRPLTAYTIGLIPWSARLASAVPTLANAVTQTEPVARLLKRLGGVAPQRPLPTFAEETFRAWFEQRAERAGTGERGRVVLWPDTFTNFLQPDVAKAGVRVLEAAGFEVAIPDRTLCCGRPLYDYGMLTTAKALLRRILDELRDDIRAGTPVVGLEPSCLAVFRDELVQLFPHDEDAKRLASQSFTLAELLEQRAGDADLPHVDGHAMVHGHCHHTSVMGLGAEEALFGRIGLDADVLDSGCCGMAGSFGFEADHYDVSVASAERVLAPAVRDADPGTVVVADGFSCRTQIGDLTDRRARHLAEVLADALPSPADGDAAATVTGARPATASARRHGVAVGVGALVALAAVVGGARRVLGQRR